MVRYKTLKEHAETNAALVRAVYEELRSRTPAGVRYTTYRLPDGVTFVHVATTDGPGENPITTLPAFQAFQKDIKARCEEPPAVTEVTVVGSYLSPDQASR